MTLEQVEEIFAQLPKYQEFPDLKSKYYEVKSFQSGLANVVRSTKNYDMLSVDRYGNEFSQTFEGVLIDTARKIYSNPEEFFKLSIFDFDGQNPFDKEADRVNELWQIYFLLARDSLIDSALKLVDEEAPQTEIDKATERCKSFVTRAKQMSRKNLEIIENTRQDRDSLLDKIEKFYSSKEIKFEKTKYSHLTDDESSQLEEIRKNPEKFFEIKPELYKNTHFIHEAFFAFKRGLSSSVTSKISLKHLNYNLEEITQETDQMLEKASEKMASIQEAMEKEAKKAEQKKAIIDDVCGRKL